MTLYVSESAVGATAEFYRRNPEFLDNQPPLAKLSVFQLDLELMTRTLDVRSPGNATTVGINFDRLRSSEARPARRYRECQNSPVLSMWHTPGRVSPIRPLHFETRHGMLSCLMRQHQPFGKSYPTLRLVFRLFQKSRLRRLPPTEVT